MEKIKTIRDRKIREAIGTAVWLAIITLGFIAAGVIEPSVTGAPEREGYKDTAVYETVPENEAVRVIHKPDYWYLKSIPQVTRSQEEIALELERTAYIGGASEAVDEWVSLGEFTLTSYCLCLKCCGIWSAEHPSRVGTDYVQRTASGTIPSENRTIGANPSVLPFGTVVLINGAEYIVEDRCGAARNAKIIDIFMSDHASAVAFGRQKAEIYIKNE